MHTETVYSFSSTSFIHHHYIFMYLHYFWSTWLWYILDMVSCFCFFEKMRNCVCVSVDFCLDCPALCVFVITRLVESSECVIWQTLTSCQGVFWHWIMFGSVGLGGWDVWGCIKRINGSCRFLQPSAILIIELALYILLMLRRLLPLNQLPQIKGLSRIKIMFTEHT